MEERDNSLPSHDETPRRASDSSLLRRFRAGNDQAATEIYLRYAHRLHHLAQMNCGDDLAQRLDAEDIVQSVFSSFFRRAREGQYEVPDGHELWKLLLVMALNKIRARGSYHRAARRDVSVTQSGNTLTEAIDDRHDERDLTVLRLVIEEILARHPPVNRDIVALRIEGHEVAEIAARVSRSRRTVERVLQEFRQELHNSLREEGVQT
jgi:RNA polymerase sigma-70 factor (ECF subfamily)